MNPRTSIDDLKLQGSNNLKRALDRQRADRAKSLSEEQKEELAQLDQLIALALRACRRGQTIKGKRNPSFANLELLTRVRSSIAARSDAAEKKGPSILGELDDAIKNASVYTRKEN